jgi:protein-S-isoprenylcysteine O-methyltransferase Ste14
MLEADSSLEFFIAGYCLVAVFIVSEGRLRKTEGARTLQRGSSDRGSTLLIGSAFGTGLVLPLVLDLLGVGIFSVSLLAGCLALLTMLAGIALRVWSARTLGEYYTRTLLTTGEQRVISSGPYAKIRHPGYLGCILLWSGFGLLTGNVILALLYPVMFVAVYLYRIDVEERMLGEALGDDYAEYRSRTWKLIPFVY